MVKKHRHRERNSVPHQVIWGKEALRDQKRCLDFLLRVNPNAAIRAANLIADGAENLEDFPGRCPCIDDTGRRELFIQFGKGAYVLRYIVDGNRVKILRVWHAKELRTEETK